MSIPRFALLASVAAAAAAVVPASPARAEEGSLLVYFGTYTGPKSKGIYVSKLDPATGALSEPELAGESVNPSFLAFHPTGKFVYAGNEIGKFEGKPAGSVEAFAVDAATGKLTSLGKRSSGGSGPCHVSVHPTGKFVAAANYGGGSAVVLPVGEDGKLGEHTGFVQHKGSGPNPSRQKEPHTHSANFSPDGRFLLAADLGLDKVLIYKLDAATGQVSPNDPASGSVPPGGGPRHLAFHPSGKFAFVCDEITSAVTAFSYDAEKGALTQLETLSTLPAGYDKPGNSTAEVAVHPSGKFVYVSNRGHDSIAGFSFDEATGKLAAIGHTPIGGKVPRNFGIDPSGMWLLAAGQSSDTVTVFRIDPKTGGLTPTGKSVTVGAPVCVRFLKTGK
jgi:6-phosphogluconolactonase